VLSAKIHAEGDCASPLCLELGQVETAASSLTAIPSENGQPPAKTIRLDIGPAVERVQFLAAAHESSRNYGRSQPLQTGGSTGLPMVPDLSW
jgi:hypothetical protein